MATTGPSPVTRWRKRRQRQDFVRVEIQVRKEDAALVRDVAAALVDPPARDRDSLHFAREDRSATVWRTEGTAGFGPARRNRSRASSRFRA